MVHGCESLAALLTKLEDLELNFDPKREDAKIYLATILRDSIKRTVKELRAVTEDDIAQHLRRRERLQSTINLGQLSKENILQRRKLQLERRLGHDLYLADAYGMRTAKNQSEQLRGLIIDHNWSTKYLRDIHDSANKIFDDLAERTEETKERRLLVNSTFVGNKLLLLKVLREKQPRPKASDMTYKLLADHIYKLELTPELDDYDSDIAAAFKFLGATPSTFQTAKELKDRERYELDMDRGVLKVRVKKDRNDEAKNGEELRQILDSSAFRVIKQAAESKGDLETVYRCIRELLSGLQGLAQDLDSYLTVESALQTIGRLIEALAVSGESAVNVCRLYELFIDELFLILATVHPYEERDFASIVSEIYRKRLPSLGKLEKKGITLDICLESSGMGAVSTALRAVFAAGREGRQPNLFSVDKDVDYYELFYRLMKKCAFAEVQDVAAADVVYATLNPSTPYKRYTVETIAKLVKQRLQPPKLDGDGEDPPLTLVVDITVENNAKDLEKLLGSLRPWLEAGKLGLILAKSYQKYAALGSGKIMSGVALGIWKAGEFKKQRAELKEAGKQGAFIALDENQLLAYLLEHTAELELGLIKSAAANAEWLATAWPAKEPFIGSKSEHKTFLKGLPFVLRRRTPGTGTGTGHGLFAELGLEHRDSFGFLKTSFLWIDTDGGYYRFTVGQEPRRRLEEMFFALGQLTGRALERGESGVRRPEEDDIRWLLEEVGKAGSPEREASLLQMAGLLRPKIKSRKTGRGAGLALCGRTLTAYEKFLYRKDAPLERVSPEMRAALVGDWAELAFMGSPKKDTARVLLGKLTVYAKGVPAYLLAEQYIKMNDGWFSKKRGGFELAKVFLKGLGVEALLEVCRALLLEPDKKKETGASKKKEKGTVKYKEKARWVLELLSTCSQLKPGLLSGAIVIGLEEDLRRRIGLLQEQLQRIRKETLLERTLYKESRKRRREIVSKVTENIIREIKLLKLGQISLKQQTLESK